jgi:Tfp pilus assembly protein FimT
MKANGFQLFECMMVCLLVAVLGGLGGISLGKLLGRSRLESAAQEMIGHLGALRAAAVSRKLSLAITVGETGRSYGFGPRGEDPAAWRDLPPGVQIVDSPGSSVTFYSRGIAVPAGSFLLANEVGRIRLIIAPTGRMRWEYLQ